VWYLRVLGPLSLERPGAPPVERFRSRKTASLLAYLALHPRAHTRAALIEIFWPETPPTQGQQSLRSALVSLRQHLEPPGIAPGSVVVATRSQVGLQPGAIETDVRRFEALVRNGDAAGAVALYRGRLLPGVYDDWAVHLGEHIDTLYEQMSALAALPPPAPRPEPSRDPPPRIGVPMPVDPCLGRETVCRRLLRQVSERAGLWTLVGPGGCGKTRLAIELANGWTGPVVFVPLAGCITPTDAPEAIARRMGVPGSMEPTPVNMARVLPQDTLLVLDNLEHLVGATLDGLLSALRREVRDLRIVATARHALGIMEECLEMVEPLALPRPAAPQESPAVALFVARTGLGRTEHDPNAVAALVRRLDGLPLAIEVTAPWAAVLPPDTLRERLEGFPLWPEVQDDETRWQVLWSTVAWSDSQLPERLRALFHGLSVFRGGAAIDDIAALTGYQDPAAALARLGALALVRVAPDAPDRYFLPEALRAYATDQLRRREDLWAVQGRHAQHFLARAEACDRLSPGAAYRAGSQALEADHENLRAALAWFLDQPTVEGALGAMRLTLALGRYWETRALDWSAERALYDALHHRGAHERELRRLRIEVLDRAGSVSLRLRRVPAAIAHFTAALLLCEQDDDLSGAARARHHLEIAEAHAS
jgi:predicted ATPase